MSAENRVLLLCLSLLLIVGSSANSQIILNEAMSANASGLLDEDGDHEDWIELLNAGVAPADLTGYGISDDILDPYLWIIPAVILQPGEFLILFASGKDRTGPELHLNFKLKRSGELLRLTDAEGTLRDEITLEALIADVSMGRLAGELRYFGEPTPGEGNTTMPYDGITPAPSFNPERGIFESSMIVEIDGNTDRLAFSSDGSIPDLPLIVPLVQLFVDTTTTLRARAFRPDWLPSEIVTHSYIIDEPVNLPVVCLTMDPPDLWDPVTGIYVMGDSTEENWPYYGANFWEDWEKFAHWEYMSLEGGGFSLDGGAKINGGWSRAQPQKAVRLVARDAYGVSEVDYPLYPETGIGQFKRLILRNCGNDFHTLTSVTSSPIPSQPTRTWKSWQAAPAWFFSTANTGAIRIFVSVSTVFILKATTGWTMTKWI